MRAEGLHLNPPVRLGLVAVAHLPDIAGQPEHLTGERQRSAPLAGSGLGTQPLDAGLPVVEGLRDRRVRLVAADRGRALVLVVDPGFGAQRLLEAVRPVQRRRTPQSVDLGHSIGNRDPALGAHLLSDQRLREDRRQIGRPGGLLGGRVQRGRRGSRKIGSEVVPVRRHLVLGQQELGALIGHGLRLADH